MTSGPFFFCVFIIGNYCEYAQHLILCALVFREIITSTNAASLHVRCEAKMHALIKLQSYYTVILLSGFLMFVLEYPAIIKS